MGYVWLRADWALSQDADNAEVLANKVCLACTTAKAPPAEALEAALSQLRAVAPEHSLLRDLAEKDSLFDEALRSQREALSTAA